MSYTDMNAAFATNRAPGAPSGFEGDDKLFVFFYDKAVPDPVKSREQSLPVFKSVTYIRIQEPGISIQVTDRPASGGDIRRFPAHYANYQAGKGEEQPGTPIEILFPDSPEIVATLRLQRVTTIQFLANLSDTAKSQMGMGASDWQQKAVKFLAAAEGGRGVTKLQGELAAANNSIEALKAQIADMNDRYERDKRAAAPGAAPVAAEETKRGPGRPRKDEPAGPFEI